MHKSYEHVTTRLSKSLSELKAELDSHDGMHEELATAAAELIVARMDVVDAVMKVEDAKN
jgi:recombinational DNA repair ATPase RecF